MKLLLDTHCFLWFIAGDTRISQAARTLIEDDSNQPLVSIASLWEMAIKLSLGRLNLAQPFEVLVPQQMRLNGIGLLGIGVEPTAVVARLPFGRHRDPFDRLLVAQATVERIPLVSADTALDEYGIRRLW